MTVHGGPDAGLSIEVVNPLPPTPLGGRDSSAGTGLIGISERATALGGTSSAGPTEEQTFAVTAWLP